MIEKLTLVEFATYKTETSLYGLEEDLFIDNSFGCHEVSFEKWLNKQRMFIKRFNTTGAYMELSDMTLPMNKWGFFTFHYERSMRTEYLKKSFPSGYFESMSKDGEIATFLPEPSGKYKYRISYYRKYPTWHECFNSREEALTKLANGGYAVVEGELDKRTDTLDWAKGLWTGKWINDVNAERISIQEAFDRDWHIPEVQELFPNKL